MSGELQSSLNDAYIWHTTGGLYRSVNNLCIGSPEEHSCSSLRGIGRYNALRQGIGRTGNAFIAKIPGEQVPYTGERSRRDRV